MLDSHAGPPVSRAQPTEMVARPDRPRRDGRNCTPPPPGHIWADQLWAWSRATGLPPLRRREDEKGSTTIEFLLCLALIIFPVIGLSAAALNWPGRLNAASGAAYEAAHSVVHSPAAAPEEGRSRAVEVWTNHGYDAGDIEVAFEGDPTARGGVYTATVTVVLPAIVIPGVGRIAGGFVSRSHTEPVPERGNAPDPPTGAGLGVLAPHHRLDALRLLAGGEHHLQLRQEAV